MGFLGYGTRALDALMKDDRFEVVCFIAPRARLCEDVYEAHEKYPDIPFSIVSDNDDLRSAVKQFGDAECFLMNACNIILNQSVLDEMSFYNIHPGDMYTNRGHQPHMWSILLGELESTIVLHKVTTGIDQGEVIAEVRRGICPDMTDLDLLNALEDEIPALLDGLYSYLTRHTLPLYSVEGGQYRRVMTYDDYMVDISDIEKDNFCEDMLRKIRARGSKHGAFVRFQNKRVYFDRLIAEKNCEASETPYIQVAEDEEKVCLVGKHKRYILHLNKIESDADR